MKTRTRQTKRRRSIAGFTLIEVLVVLLIIAVLVAIAAPSWSALLTRQRVSAVRDQASQVIRQAQAEAKRTKLARVVVFDLPANGIPRVATQRQPLDSETERTAGLLDAAQIGEINVWQDLGNGEINPGQLEVSTAPAGALNQIVFDANGAIDPISASKAGTIGSRPYIFTVNVRHKGGSSGANRCVIVDTLLGATRTAEGTDCPT